MADRPRSRTAFDGLLFGICLGILAGSVDALLTLGGLAAGGAFTLILWCGALGGTAGMLVGLLSGRAQDPGRSLRMVLAFGALFYLLATTANVLWLPGFLDPISLGADLAVAVVSLIAARRIGPRLRLPVLAPLSGVFGGGVALCLALLGGEPEVPSPRPASDAHPPVLLIVVDTLRADHTSLMGYHRETTPNLTRFAEEALVYDLARTSSSWTKPSVATIVTGLAPAVHTAEENWAKLPLGALTVAETLQAGGYQTALFSDNPFVSTGFGLAQGFDHVSDRLTGRGLAQVGIPKESLLGHVVKELVIERVGWIGEIVRKERSAARLSEEFLTWLDGTDREEPWFAYLHYMDPHNPYSAPAPWNRKFTDDPRPGPSIRQVDEGLAPFRPGDDLGDSVRDGMIDAYDGEIAYWDDCFGALLRALRERGVLDDLVVLITSDHGESFYAHKTWLHGNSLYEELVHVPLVLSVPGGPTGRVPWSVSLTGIAETLVRAAGYEPPRSMSEEGQALLPPPGADRGCRAKLMWEGATELSMVTGRGVKWILSIKGKEERLEAYDLAIDPHERVDLAGQRREEAVRAKDEILRRAAAESKLALSPDEAKGDAELDDVLRGLGYLGD